MESVNAEWRLENSNDTSTIYRNLLQNGEQSRILIGREVHIVSTKTARTFEQKMRYLEQHGSAEEIQFSVSWELLKWLRDALLLPAQEVNAKTAALVTTAKVSQAEAA